MAAGLEISINLTRAIIRETILNAIRDLHEKQGIDMRDIISELLSVCFSRSYQIRLRIKPSNYFNTWR